MVIAPRQIERSGEIANNAQSLNLSVSKRSSGNKFNTDIFVLDTIGELASCYSLAHICIVGGSIVSAGGHNPIEPAGHGKPVLFGPYMEDFEEISDELLQSGGAFCVKDHHEITQTIEKLLLDETLRLQCGNAALKCVSAKKGVIDRHIKLITDIM